MIAASALATPAVAAPSSSGRSASYDSLETGIVSEINTLRRRHGLAPLRVSRPLTLAAEAHGGAMATRGFFSHTSGDGTPFWKRIERYYGSSGYGLWSVGENLAWAAPSIDAATTVRMWMNSPGHRRVLLTPKWREVGLAAVRVQAGPGVYGGRPVTVVTADFGVRR